MSQAPGACKYIRLQLFFKVGWYEFAWAKTIWAIISTIFQELKMQGRSYIDDFFAQRKTSYNAGILSIK